MENAYNNSSHKKKAHTKKAHIGTAYKDKAYKERAYEPNAEAPLINGLDDVIACEREKPCRERYPLQTSYDIFVEAAKHYGDDLALRFLATAAENETPVDVSFVQLLARITQTANGLQALGVGGNDTVSVMLTNMPESHYSTWGAQVAGVSGPINPLLESEHVIEIMNTTQARVLVTMAPLLQDDAHWQKVEAILEQVPSLDTLLYVTLDNYTESTIPAIPDRINAHEFNGFIAEQPGDKLAFSRKISGNDIASCFHTGGTTGRPKIAQITHYNIAFSAQIVEHLTRYKGQASVMSALPLFHIYGLIAAGIATLYSGRPIVMMSPDGFRNPNVLKFWWHHAARLQVKSFGSVPTILAALMQVPHEQFDLSCLEDVGSGAAPLPKQLRRDFESKYQVRVTNGWGMTETTSLGTRQRAEAPGPEGCIGTRFPYGEIKIVELDGSRSVRECESNESGVLLIRGPNVFKGYLNAEDNDKAWVDGDWFNTGDVAFMDEDGFVTLTGRAKDLIIRGGHNIDPVMIEDPLSRHPAVAQVVAVGQPDIYAGELPIVYIQLKPDQPVTADELAAWCEEHIPERAARPKRIVFVDEMPVTAVGKFFKPALRNKAIETVMLEALREQQVDGEIHADFEQSRGHVARVKLADKGDMDAARELLEKYPIAVEFV